MNMKHIYKGFSTEILIALWLWDYEEALTQCKPSLRGSWALPPSGDTGAGRLGTSSVPWAEHLAILALVASYNAASAIQCFYRGHLRVGYSFVLWLYSHSDPCMSSLHILQIWRRKIWICFCVDSLCGRSRVSSSRLVTRVWVRLWAKATDHCAF